MVRRAVLATNHTRGHLDPVSATAAGPAYADRWTPERAGWLWAHTGGTSTSTATTTQPAPGGTPTRVAGLNLSYMRNQNPDPATNPDTDTDADALAELLSREIDAQFGTTDEPPTTTRRHVQGLHLSFMDNQPPVRPAVPLLLSRALDAFEGENVHTETLAAALHTTPEILGRLLPLIGITTHKNAIAINGKQARGYKRDVFQDAADRLTRGDLTAPDEVHRWRPQRP